MHQKYLINRRSSHEKVLSRYIFVSSSNNSLRRLLNAHLHGERQDDDVYNVLLQRKLHNKLFLT